MKSLCLPVCPAWACKRSLRVAAVGVCRKEAVTDAVGDAGGGDVGAAEREAEAALPQGVRRLASALAAEHARLREAAGVDGSAPSPLTLTVPIPRVPAAVGTPSAGTCTCGAKTGAAILW